jgi:hypothetical protein
VKREDGQILDLAEAKVSRRVDVDLVSGTGKTVDSESMFQALEDAVRKEHDAILRGLGHHWERYGSGKQSTDS